MCARNHAILLDVGRGLDETERRIAAALMASPRASLLRDLPATVGVRSWDAYDLMKVFPAGFAWSAGLLTTEQFSSLAPILREPRDAPGIGPLDDELIGQLAADARASYRDLAARLATSASTVRRRLDLLESAHMLRLACDVDLGLLGIHADALLWIATGPGRLEATGHQLSRHPQGTVRRGHHRSREPAGGPRRRRPRRPLCLPDRDRRIDRRRPRAGGNPDPQLGKANRPDTAIRDLKPASRAAAAAR